MNRMIVLMIIVQFQLLLLLLQIRPSSQNEIERFDVLSTLYAQKLSVIDGNFGKNYTNQTNSDSTIIYKFKYSEIKNKTTAIRISIRLQNTIESDSPLLFVARQQRGVLSWKLPLPLENVYEFDYASRTLCPLDQKHRTSDIDQVLYAEVSTMSNKNIIFSLEAIKMKNLEIISDEVRNISLTPPEPQYYMYTFPRNVESVIVKIESEDKKCMVLSVQDVQCPVFDLDKDVKFSGMYQTVTKQGAITVERTKYEDESFFIVLVMKPKDYNCNGIDEIQTAGEESTKRLSLRVYGTNSSKYYKGIVGASVLFLSFYLIAFFIGLYYHDGDKNRGVWIKIKEQEIKDMKEDLLDRDILPGSYGTTSGSQNNVMVDRSLPEIQAAETPEQTTDHNDSIDSSILFVADLAKKSRKGLIKNYGLFYQNLAAISIFYGLAVLQLVLTYQRVLNMTGDQDMCYYNFDCAHPLGLITSFNNVFSNIGYILLGILFLILVARRDVIYNKALENDKKIDKEMGIPQYFGLFYAMGLALIMEGIMSACYHVCPNSSNFQFDTSFMYIIACLCMLKIYQSRHPDVSATAHTSYIFMAFVILIAVIGVLYGTEIFWIVFAVCYMLASLVISVHIYYMGRCKKILLHTWQNICTRPHPMYKDRFLFLVLGNIINWSIAIVGAVVQPGDFATYLLGIFIGNLMFYTIYYTLMKIRNKECIHPLAILFFICAIVFWIPAIYFFLCHLTSWRLNPSQSREGNKDCLIFDFYDAHDIWHFLSAISMFFSFLIILTLDDDLFSTRRDKIPVF